MRSPRRSRVQHYSDAAWQEREAEAGVPEWDRGVRHGNLVVIDVARERQVAGEIPDGTIASVKRVR